VASFHSVISSCPGPDQAKGTPRDAFALRKLELFVKNH
jgi:hypothetical protein